MILSVCVPLGFRSYFYLISLSLAVAVLMNAYIVIYDGTVISNCIHIFCESVGRVFVVCSPTHTHTTTLDVALKMFYYLSFVDLSVMYPL